MCNYRMEKAIAILLLGVLSPLALAHPGHSGDVGAAHDMEHMLWTLLAIAVVAVAGLVFAHKKWNLWK
ncbi:hypothetical protein [Pseudomaricurvus sp.]|uniref:hypothetical protein n=1 Tax=Pseudomaricurvus sp. TaxID=2004510 RepID=UPI003F6ACD78